MEPRHYFSIRSRFAEKTSTLPIVILTALAAFTIFGILFDIAHASA